MSALPPIADMLSVSIDVRFVPLAEVGDRMFTRPLSSQASTRAAPARYPFAISSKRRRSLLSGRKCHPKAQISLTMVVFRTRHWPHPLTRISAPDKQQPPSPTGREWAPRHRSPRRRSRPSYLSWTSAFRALSLLLVSTNRPPQGEAGWHISQPNDCHDKCLGPGAMVMAPGRSGWGIRLGSYPRGCHNRWPRRRR